MADMVSAIGMRVVRPVQLIEVDVVGIHPFEALLRGVDEFLAPEMARQRLGGHKDSIPHSPNRLPNDLFRSVAFGRVDEYSSKIDPGTKGLDASAVLPRPERQCRDPDAGAPNGLVSNGGVMADWRLPKVTNVPWKQRLAHCGSTDRV